MKYTLHILFVIVILLTLLGCSNMNGNDAQIDPMNNAIWFDDVDEFEIQKTEDEWKVQLTDDQYKILRKKGTEKPTSSPLDKNFEKGTYYSAASLQPVYSSEAKFDSGTGWPSFYEPITPDAVIYKEDYSWLGRKRIEILDSKSGSHLGHVFPDGPAPTGLRYCMNGDALIFVPEGEEPTFVGNNS